MNTAENFVIGFNIFDRGKYILIHCGAEKASDLPILNGNTFIQNAGGEFGRFNVNPTKLQHYNTSIVLKDNFRNNTFAFIEELQE
jgi:hypothetical protein